MSTLTPDATRPGPWGPGQFVTHADWGSLGPGEHGAVDRNFLEDALASHVAGAGRARLDPQRLGAVLARMGLLGRPPLTLAEAGRLAGLTGERVRQLEARVRKHFADAGPTALPELDAALSAVARAAPMPAGAVGQLLAERGVSAGPFCAESLVRAAGLLGREVPFVILGAGSTAVVVPRLTAAAAANAGAIEPRARRQAERTGAFTMATLEKELSEERITVSRRQMKLVMATCEGLEPCGQGWLCFRDARPAGSFVRASLRMLAVTSPLAVHSLHDGLRRHNAFRRLPPPPPVQVLAAVYRSHPSFVVEPDGRVAPAQPVELSIVGPLNQRIVEIIRAAGGVLARPDLLDACHRAELNLTSVNLYTTYSECLERVGPALFAPRGSAVAAPVGPGRSTRRDPDHAFGRTPDGRPWMVARVTSSTWANGVVHVPAGLRPLVEDRRFVGESVDGSPLTTLGVDRHGNSWGWTGFLRRAGVQPGQLVRATFDLADETVLLEAVAPADPGR
ncbi:MAG: hypothetical protein ACT4PX_00140 [Actinomycetota bacterium]